MRHNGSQLTEVGDYEAQNLNKKRMLNRSRNAHITTTQPILVRCCFSSQIKNMKLNHNRPLSDFQSDIDKLKANGYNPIAVSQMYFEDTFVFETNEEATKAYRQFERDEKEEWIGEIVGWWHGKEDFEKVVKEYETENDGYSKVLVHWLVS